VKLERRGPGVFGRASLSALTKALIGPNTARSVRDPQFPWVLILVQSVVRWRFSTTPSDNTFITRSFHLLQSTKPIKASATYYRQTIIVESSTNHPCSWEWFSSPDRPRSTEPMMTRVVRPRLSLVDLRTNNIGMSRQLVQRSWRNPRPLGHWSLLAIQYPISTRLFSFLSPSS
jgi:hypothetical protein